MIKPNCGANERLTELIDNLRKGVAKPSQRGNLFQVLRRPRTIPLFCPREG